MKSKIFTLLALCMYLNVGVVKAAFGEWSFTIVSKAPNGYFGSAPSLCNMSICSDATTPTQFARYTRPSTAALTDGLQWGAVDRTLGVQYQVAGIPGGNVAMGTSKTTSVNEYLIVKMRKNTTGAPQVWFYSSSQSNIITSATSVVTGEWVSYLFDVANVSGTSYKMFTVIPDKDNNACITDILDCTFTNTPYLVSASPIDGSMGTVSGGGYYATSKGAVLTANAKSGYRFLNWTEASTVLSTSTSYSIASVTAAHTIVPNFVSGYTINATAVGGTISGLALNGGYDPNASVDLIATATGGNRFIGWVENGKIISGAALEYVFTATANRTLIAVFGPAGANYTSIAPSSLWYEYGTVGVGGAPVFTAQGSFAIDYVGLTAPVVIAPTTNFDISLTKDSYTSGASITLNQDVNGNVPYTTIYVRLKEGLGYLSSSSAANTLSITSTGLTNVNVALTGSVSKKYVYINSPILKTYDGTSVATVAGAYGVVGSDAVSITGTFGAAGYTGTVTQPTGGLTGAQNANYQIGSILWGKVVTAPLTITGLSGVNKAYDGTTAATLTGTPVYNGLMNSETFTVTGTATATFGNAAVANNKAVTVTGYTAPSTNYSITQPTGLTANITAIPSTWSGTGSWSTTANWTGLVSPNAGTDVTVPNGTSLTVDGSPTVNNITIEAGGKLNVSTALTALGTVTLKAAKDATSFSTQLDAGITASSVRLFKTIDDTKWYFVSFPCDVTVASITKSDGTSLGTLGTDWFIKYYDGIQRGTSGNTAGSNWKLISAATDPTKLKANQGYIIALNTGKPDTEILFPLNTSILAADAPKTIGVSENPGAATNAGWNLIGQPFLSNYIANTTNTTGSFNIYVSDGTSTYTPFDMSTTIPTLAPMSAYFVQASTALAGTGIGFGVAGRQLARSMVNNDLTDRVQLNLTSPTGTDYALLTMDNNFSNNYEIGYDLEKWIGTDTNKPQVYTQLSGINYAFNALPMDNVYKLPLGFYTKTAGQNTISVDVSKAPGLSQLMLTDNSNGASVDLLTSNYSFNAASGTDDTRFVLTAKRVATAITPIGTGNDEPVIIAEDGKLVLGNLTGVTNVRVYDAIGHMLFNKIANTNLVEVPISVAGVYTIQLNAGAKNWTKKQVVNQK
jgi:hypothetical protein